MLHFLKKKRSVGRSGVAEATCSDGTPTATAPNCNCNCQNVMTTSFCAYKKQGRLPKIQQLPVRSRVVSNWVDSNRIDQGAAVEKMALAAFLLALTFLSILRALS